MKIFISWSGPVSKGYADTLRKYLPYFNNRFDPWFSSEDIKTGLRWNDEIARELGDTIVGVLCLTPNNLEKPWLLFEAGALAKSVDNTSCVIPYLIGLEPNDVKDPLAQFQGVQANEEGTSKLLTDLNKLMKSDDRVNEGQLNDLFNKYWPDIEESFKKVPTPTKDSSPVRNREDILDEILTRVRNLDHSFNLYNERHVRIDASTKLAWEILKFAQDNPTSKKRKWSEWAQFLESAAFYNELGPMAKSENPYKDCLDKLNGKTE